MSKGNFSIEFSAGYFNCTCGLCGHSFELRVPLSICLRGCHVPVCDDCSRESAPGLLPIVQQAAAEHEAANALEAAEAAGPEATQPADPPMTF